jgi:Domain of unknown function (DUF6457)
MTTLQNWTEAVCAEFDVHADDAVVRTILDLARDVAHQVDRPAAPVTSYLLGLAVGSGVPVAEAVSRLHALVADWPAAPQ